MNDNWNKLDKIILSPQDSDKIMEWSISKQDLLKKFKPTLPECIIEIDFLEMKIIHYCKEISKNRYHFETWATSDNKKLAKSVVIAKFDVYFSMSEHVEFYNETAILYKSEEETRSAQGLIMKLYVAAMVYMDNYTEYVTSIRHSVLIKKKGKGSSNKSRITRIGRKIYNITASEKIQTIQTEKREINRQSECWSVRGHERKYKSGKIVFIHAHLKGDKTKTPEPKIYKI